MAQRHRGDRKAQTVRFPALHHAVYEEIARRKGLEVGEYIVQALAAAHGLDVPDWARDRSSDAQEALPVAS